MQVSKNAWYAVITVDFIGFSPLPPATREALYHLVKQGSGRLQELFPETMPEPVEVYRGDAWQMLLVRPAAAFRAGLWFRAFIRARAALRKIDVRMAIGVGPVDYVPEGRVSAGDGTAFRLSGKLLESISAPRAGTFRFALDGSPAALAIDDLAVLAGEIAGKWSPGQARAVEGALAGLTRQQIASDWGGPISSQAVSGHLRRAGWPSIRHAAAMYEAGLNALMSPAAGT